MNRPELYKILDAEKKIPGAISGVQNGDETIAYANKSGWKKNAKKNSNQNVKKSKKTNNSGKRQNQNGGGSRSVDRMCRFCTQNAGKPVYHDAPYGGGKNCKNGKKGKPRQSRRVNGVSEDATADGSDSPSADQDENDQYEEGDDSNECDSDCGALEEDFYPSFGGGFGSGI